MKELHGFEYTPKAAQGFNEAVAHWNAVGWDAMKPNNPLRYTLTRKHITPAALEAFTEIGGCVITKGRGEEEVTITLDKKIYHQFHEHGIIFTTDGRAFDPSYHGVTLSSVRWSLRTYKSAQYGGGLIDKLVSQRDEEWVLFPPNTDEVAEGSLMVYTTPDEECKEIVIDEHGYLYLRTKKRAFKRGDQVYVILQGARLYGTYNTNQPEQSDCPELAYVDFDNQEHEYILINTNCVFHVK